MTEAKESRRLEKRQSGNPATTFLNGFFTTNRENNMTNIMQSAVSVLNRQIDEAKQAARTASEQTIHARQVYETAITQGDIKSADAALQKQAEQTRLQQIQSDRATALEAQRKDAERKDYTPAAQGVIKAAQAHVEAENALHAEVKAAIETLASMPERLINRNAETTQAISLARDAANNAHQPRPHFDRQRMELAVPLTTIREIAHALGNLAAVQSQNI